MIAEHPLIKSNNVVNMQVYAQKMSQTIDLKLQDIDPFIPESYTATIRDEGCADGAMIDLLSRKYPRFTYVGVDLDKDLLAMAVRRQYESRRIPTFYQKDLLQPTNEQDEADVVLCNSVLHEIYSYGNGVESVRKYLRLKQQQLRSSSAFGGRLIVRDVVGPSNGDQPVYLWTDYNSGIRTSRVQEFSPGELSIRSRFLRFAQDFAPRKIKFQTVCLAGEDDCVYRLSLRDAMEFITHMDYTDNWVKEVQESYCFWDFETWIEELKEAGFTIVDGSKAYTNKWRVDNAFTGKVSLYHATNDDSLIPMDLPVTNMVIAADA